MLLLLMLVSSTHFHILPVGVKLDSESGVPAQQFVDLVEFQQALYYYLAAFYIGLYFLVLLHFWVMGDKIVILPKLLQLIDSVLENYSINLNEIVDFVPVFVHEDGHQHQVLESKSWVMHIVIDAVEDL